MAAMKLIDLRDPDSCRLRSGADEGTSDEDRSYLLLAPDVTYRFRFDGGNIIPWAELAPQLESRLPGHGHDALGDVAIEASEVIIDHRCGESGIAWICTELVERGIVPPSAPVVVAHSDGFDEAMGALGEVARGRSLAVA